MLRYLRARESQANPQALLIFDGREAYFPIFVHAAVDQDRAVGDSRTFHEHTHNLYHIVLYTESKGFYMRSGAKYRAEPGTLVIISPGEPHDFVSDRRSSVYSEITFALGTKTGQVLTLPFEKILHAYTGVAGQLHDELQLTRDTTHELVITMIQIMDYLQSPSSPSFKICTGATAFRPASVTSCFRQLVIHRPS